MGSNASLSTLFRSILCTVSALSLAAPLDSLDRALWSQC
jgi:hypothetical protein